MSPSAHVTALGHAGFQLSSSPAGNAVAAHTSSGEFIASFAIGSRFTRSRSGHHRLVVPTELPFQTSWYYLRNGTKFKYKKLSTGHHGILAVDTLGQRVVFHKQDGFLHITPQGKTAQRVWIGQMDAEGRLKDPGGALRTFIDKPDAWRGDEDLRVAERAAHRHGDISTHPFITICPHTTANGDCGDTGDGDGFGDFGGDGGGAGGDTGATPHPNPTPKPTPKPKYSCPPGTTMSAECWIDLANLAACVLSLIASGILTVPACVAGSEFTLGASCVAAIVLLAASSAALAGAWGAYAKDNCPIPKKGQAACS